jgi:hypothetical protein
MPGRDEDERVQVLLAAAEAPVQAGRGNGAAGVAGLEVTEHRPAGDHLAGGHGRVDRLVGAAQAAGMVH